MQGGGHQAQADGAQPDHVVGTRGLEQPAAQPHAEEGAQLVAEKDEAEQGGDVAHAEDLRHQPIGQRRGAEPHQAHHGGKGVEREGAERQQHEQRHRGGAHQVDAGQQVFSAVPCTEQAAVVGAEDVGQRNDRQGRHGVGGPHALVQQVGRQMRGDKGELKATGQKTQVQEPEAAVAEGFAQCRGQRQCSIGARRRRRLVLQRARQRQQAQHAGRHHQ